MELLGILTRSRVNGVAHFHLVDIRKRISIGAHVVDVLFKSTWLKINPPGVHLNLDR